MPDNCTEASHKLIRILLLGDGNFSFSLALAQLLSENNHREATAAHRYLGLSAKHDCHHFELICTSFDTREEVLEKYPESAGILHRLETSVYASGRVRTRVLHRINAWEGRRHFAQDYPHGFHVVLWNHPHLGEENFQLHRFLMAHFLASAKEILSPDADDGGAKICVSLVQGQETRWDLVGQAARNRLQLLDAQPLAFEEHAFPGYICKRNKNGQSFKNQATQRYARSAMKSFVYRFGLAAVEEPVQVPLLAISQLSLGPTTAPIPVASECDADTKGALEDAKTVTIVYDPESRKRDRQAKHYRSKNQAAPTPQTNSNKPAGAATNTIYACPECKKTYPSLRAIQSHHQNVHVLQKEVPAPVGVSIPCPAPGCTRTFSRPQDLWYHQTSKHSQLTQEEERAIMGDHVAVNVRCSNGDANGDNENSKYKYYPCEVCGQSVLDTNDNSEETPGENNRNGSPLSYGMLIHLESLKPIVGMKMECPLRRAESQHWCRSEKRFMERRALEQHFRLCRQRMREHHREESLQEQEQQCRSR